MHETPKPSRTVRKGWVVQVTFWDHVLLDGEEPDELAECVAIGRVLDFTREKLVLATWLPAEGDPHADALNGRTRFVIARGTILDVRRLA